MTKRLKKFVAIATLMASVMMIAAPSPAYALTAEELADQIATLQAQLTALTAQLAELTGEEVVVVSGCDISSFDRNLEVGDTGDDVKCLQIVLNSDSDTQLADSGVGSSGEETSYFGPLTKAAVIKFQELYADEVLASWGLTAGTGFVGSTSRAKLNELLVGVVADDEEEEEEVVPEGPGLTVALAADTPVTTAIPYDSSVTYLKFVLVSDEDVNINSITITAGGLGTYTNIDDVAIFGEDGIRVSSTKSVSSEGNAIFNFPVPLVVEAGVSQTLSVKASVPVGGASSVFYLGISDSSDIISDASEVNGTFPINGNPMNILAVTVGSVTIAAADDLAPTVSFGEDDVLLADFDIEVSATEDLLFSVMRFRNGGTNDDSLVSNLILLCDGEEVSTTELSDRYAVFNVSNLLLEKSDTVTCEVRGDIGTGSAGDTVKFYIKDESDVTILCKNTGYRANVDMTDLNTTTEAQNVLLAAGDFTIDFDNSSTTGTPNQEVRPDTKNVVIATLKMTSNAENATIESMTGGATHQFEVQGTGLALADILAGSVEMRDIDTGSIYDLAEDRQSDTEWYLSMTEEISLVKGISKTFEIRLDLTSTISDEETLKVILEDGAMTITGDVSSESITDILPSSVTSATSTVEISSLDITTRTLTDMSIVGGAEDVIIYQGSMDAGDSSAVTLKTVTISEVSTDSSATVKLFSDDNITKLDLYLNGLLMKTRANRITEASAVGSGMGEITFSSLDTYNVIPASTTVTLVLKATFASSLNGAGTFALGVTHASTDVISRDVDNELIEETVTSTSAESRTLTLATEGTLTVELLDTNIKANKDMYVVAGSSGPTGRYLGELIFTTNNEAIKVTELRLVQDGTADYGDIASISLVEANGDVVISKAVDSSGNFVLTNANLEFPADESTSYFIVANTNGINVQYDATSTATSGRTVQYHLNPTLGVVAEGVDSGEDIDIVANAFSFGASSGNAAAWSTEEAYTGSWSSKLTHAGGASKRAYVTFTPLTGITLDELMAAPATYSFYYRRAEDKIGPQLELTFTDGSSGSVELTMEAALYDYTTDDLTDEWIKKTMSSTEQTHWYASNSAGTAYNYGSTIVDLSGLIAAMIAADPASTDTTASIGAWTMTKVLVDLGWSGDTNTAYVDDITIDGVTNGGKNEWSDNEIVSKTGTILGSAVYLIENDMADGTLTSGPGRMIGKYTVYVDTGSNRNSDNTSMKAALNELKITSTYVITNATTTDITNVKAYIEGDSSNKTDAITIDASTETDAINLTTLDSKANEVDGTVSIIVIGDIAALHEYSDYLQTEIDDLSTDFTYSDGTTTNNGDCKLTIDEVMGGILTQ